MYQYNDEYRFDAPFEQTFDQRQGPFFGQFFPGGPFFPGGQFFPGFQQPPPPMGGVGGAAGPPGPPPSFTPSLSAAQQLQTGPGILAVDPGAIRPCRFRFVYIWLDNGQQFWAWLTFVGRNSAAGFRWIGFRWVFFGIDLRRIEAFLCF